MTTEYHVQINGGAVEKIQLRTPIYTLAAMAALAMLEYEGHPEYDTVKIWIPSLVDAGYGPYFYAFDGHQIGIAKRDRWF